MPATVYDATLKHVDDQGNETILYLDTKADRVSISPNRNQPSITNLQSLIDALASSAFTEHPFVEASSETIEAIASGNYTSESLMSEDQKSVLQYTSADDTVTVTGIDMAAVESLGLDTIVIPDTIDGKRVILDIES